MTKPVEKRENPGAYAEMYAGEIPRPEAGDQRSEADAPLSPQWKQFIDDALKDRHE